MLHAVEIDEGTRNYEKIEFDDDLVGVVVAVVDWTVAWLSLLADNLLVDARVWNLIDMELNLVMVASQCCWFDYFEVNSLLLNFADAAAIDDVIDKMTSSSVELMVRIDCNERK